MIARPSTGRDSSRLHQSCYITLGISSAAVKLNLSYYLYMYKLMDAEIEKGPIFRV